MYFETWIDTDLQKPVTPTHLHGVFFQGDAAANLLGVNVYSGGEPFALGGTCKVYIYKANGSEWHLDGTITDNKATVTLPANAYTVAGPVNIVIRQELSNIKTTLAMFRGYVYPFTTS